MNGVFRHPFRLDTGVVDENIARFVSSPDRIEELFNSGRVGNAALDRNRFSPVIAATTGPAEAWLNE
jgi:hypothetical protein